MRPIINLRFDLKKLSDGELSGRLDFFYLEHEAAKQRTWLETPLWYSVRGPIAHPFAYFFFSYCGITLMPYPPWRIVKWLKFDQFKATYHMHLCVCEIRDIRDEIDRRRINKNI